jgi:hypothetical protein
MDVDIGIDTGVGADKGEVTKLLVEEQASMVKNSSTETEVILGFTIFAPTKISNSKDYTIQVLIK